MNFLKFNFILLALAILLSGCNEPSSPEAAIRAKIEAAQQAVEDKDAREAVASLADDFSGNHGMDKQALRRLLAVLFLQHKNIHVVITRLDIKINEYDASTAKMEAVVLATGAERLLPKDGRMLQISGDWLNIDDDWQLKNISWK